MKNLIIHLLITFSYLAILNIFSLNVFAQECDDCSHPRVALYDCQVQVPRPQGDSIGHWWGLFWTSAVTNSEFVNNDPSKDCLTFYDGAVINALTLQENTLIFGQEYANLPPQGEITSADYLFVSTVEGGSGEYTFTLTLETAVSREVVKSVTVNFNDDVEVQKTAGKTAAGMFMPLFQTIRNFEVDKRNNDESYAIRDMLNRNSTPEMVITPAKTKLEPDEEIDIEVEMIDCDGKPLGNREIFFTDTTVNEMNFTGISGGKIEPPVVRTDASGRATVKFIAGKDPGLVQINGFYPHLKPCGRSGGFIGNSVVVIGKLPEDRWILQANISEQTTRTIDSSWSGGGVSGTFTVREKSAGTAFITGFIQNESSDFNLSCYEEYDCFLENVKVSSSWSQNYFKNYYVNWGAPLPDASIESAAHSGSAETGYTGFEFHYPYEEDEIVIAVQCGGVANGHTNWKHTTCCPSEWENESNESSVLFHIGDGYLPDQCSVKKTDSSFTIAGSSTNVVSYPFPGGGVEIITTITTLNARLNLDGSFTGVEKTDHSLPNTFALKQNYPNPFNPSTVIKYSVPHLCFVTLKVYDLLGNEILTIVQEEKPTGTYEVEFNGNSLSSGVYFYKMHAGDFVQTKKLLLIK